jgi:hypothetical protein
MIGQQLQVAVLLDTDRAGEEARSGLVKRWLTRYQDRKGSPTGSFLRASSTVLSTVEIGTRRGFFAFVFPAGSNQRSVTGERRSPESPKAIFALCAECKMSKKGRTESPPP